MQLQMHNVWTYVLDATPEEREFLRELLSAEVEAKKPPNRRSVADPGFVTICQYDFIHKRFGAGLTKVVEAAAKQAGFMVVVSDVRQRNKRFATPDMDRQLVPWLRDYQWEALRKMMLGYKRGILSAPTGAGKCLGLGTLVQRADGSTVAVEDVCVGDSLLGPDGLPREVLSTSRGVGPLYELCPANRGSVVCNDVHVLTLWHTKHARLEDITLNEFLRLPEEERAKYRAAYVNGRLLSTAQFYACGIGQGEYAGFTLTGDGRFLLADGFVTHNTEIIIAATRVAPAEWLYLSNRADLPAQTAGRFQSRTNERAGTFVNGQWQRGTSNFTVATFQSIQAAVKSLRKGGKFVRQASPEALLTEIQGVLVDEVHIMSGPSYGDTLNLFENALYRFGFSATAFFRSDLDTLRTLGAIGPITAQISFSDLADMGVVARPKINMVRCQQTVNVYLDWQKLYESLIVYSEKRNELLLRITAQAAKPSILFVESLPQLHDLVSGLSELGMRVAAVYGDIDKGNRATAVKRIESGDADVLIATSVFHEGVDIPVLRSVIIGGGKESGVGSLQRVGRGTRVVEGKTTFEVWDVLDVGHRVLEEHANGRKTIYESAGYEVTVIDNL